MPIGKNSSTDSPVRSWRSEQGTAQHFRSTPWSVRSVTALEPDVSLRRRAESAATISRTPIRVSDGRAEPIPTSIPARTRGTPSRPGTAAMPSTDRSSVARSAHGSAAAGRTSDSGRSLTHWRQACWSPGHSPAGQLATMSCSGCRPRFRGAWKSKPATPSSPTD